MRLQDWVDVPKKAELRAPRSADEARAQASERRPTPAPRPAGPARNSAAFEARLQNRPSVPSARDAVLSGRVGAPSARTGPLNDEQKQAERAAALSGNFSKVAAPARTQEGGGEWGAVGVWAPMEPATDAERMALNAANWTTPAAEPKGKMPDSSFEAFKDLAPHQYRVNNEELDRIQKTYDSARADASGYRAPTAAVVANNMPLMSFDEVESAELTWDAYNALGDQQKAAVDFNTLLVDAREKDLNKSTYMNDVDRMAYDDEVKRLFGDGRGSDVLAPETVKLLSSLDMDLVGQDLDEYLSLDRAIDTTELPKFKFSTGQIKKLDQKLAGGGEVTYDQVRAPENIAAVDTVAIQNAQNLIKNAVANPESLTFDLNTLMNGPTADMQLGELPLGFGNETSAWKGKDSGALNAFFQTGKQALAGEIQPEGAPADPAERLAWLMDDMTTWPGYSEETPAQFMDFVSRQAQLLGQYGSSEEKTTAAILNTAIGKGE